MRVIRSALLVAVAMFFVSSRADAHPGSGIVVDRAGTIYFVVAGTNVIMKVSRDGRSTALDFGEQLRLPHHLVLGKDGSLYVASDCDGIVWRLGADGMLREHFNPKRAMLPKLSRLEVGFGGDPFTVDSAGNVYALAASGATSIVRIAPGGALAPIATRARFSRLHFGSMAWGPDGALYISDVDRVWRIAGGNATAIVPRGAQLLLATGIAVDSASNIYVADYSAERVVRLAPDGIVNTPKAVARLRLRHPTGVTVADGAVYALYNAFGGAVV